MCVSTVRIGLFISPAMEEETTSETTIILLLLLLLYPPTTHICHPSSSSSPYLHVPVVWRRVVDAPVSAACSR